MRVLAPAKLNLFLELLGRRPDGYHEIVTVMQTVDMADELHFEPLPRRVEVVCSDRRVPPDERNLCARAANALREMTGLDKGVRIWLSKRIPPGGGLGGASSDAAAALLALNRFWQLGLSKKALTEAAAQLGSDVAFFIKGGTALCRGRGEKVVPIEGIPLLTFLILCPDVHVSTAAVYGNTKMALTGRRRAVNIFLQEFRSGDPDRCGRALFNRLESPALELYPALRRARAALEQQVPAGVCMTGSGSCFYAVCRSQKEGREARRRLQKEGWEGALLVRSLNVTSDAAA